MRRRGSVLPAADYEAQPDACLGRSLDSGIYTARQPLLGWTKTRDVDRSHSTGNRLLGGSNLYGCGAHRGELLLARHIHHTEFECATSGFGPDPRYHRYPVLRSQQRRRPDPPEGRRGWVAFLAGTELVTDSIRLQSGSLP